MKRIIISLTCFLIIAMQINAMADEILFREVPWGSNKMTFEEMIGYRFWYSDGYIKKWEKQNGGDPVFGYYYEPQYEPCSLDAILYLYNEDFKVAGYKVYSMHANFMLTITNDMEVDRKKDNATLYRASYVFDVVNYETAYYGLRDKLNKVYGEYSEKTYKNKKKEYSSQNGNYEYSTSDIVAEWYGDNNTACRLRCYLVDSPYQSDEVWSYLELSYWKTDIENDVAVLQEKILFENYKKEQLEWEKNAENIDGL